MLILRDVAVFFKYVVGIGLIGAILCALVCGVYGWYQVLHPPAYMATDYVALGMMWTTMCGGGIGFVFGAVGGLLLFLIKEKGVPL